MQHPKNRSFVSRLPAHNNRTYTTYPLETILKEIQRGNTTIPGTADTIADKTLRGITQYARDLLVNQNLPLEVREKAYSGCKTSMPAFCPAGVLDDDSQLVQVSYIGCLDVDDPHDVIDAMVFATENPHTLAVFRSLRGDRLKVLFRIAPTSQSGHPLTPQTYQHAWLAGCRGYEEIGGIEFVQNPQTHLCALVHDRNIYIKLDALPLLWDVDISAYFEDTSYKKGRESEMSALAKLPIEYRDAIVEMEWRSNGWGKTQLPCLFTQHEHDAWGPVRDTSDRHEMGYAVRSNSNAMGVRKNAENDYTFSCRKCGQSKRYSDTQRVHRALERIETSESTDTENHETQLQHKRDTLQAKLHAIFEEIRRSKTNHTKPTASLIKGFTGLGKSRASKEVLAANMDKMIENENAIISVSLNSDIRDQDYGDMLMKYGRDRVFNWKGRSHGFDEIAEIPMQSRETDETLFNKGVLCPINDAVKIAQDRGLSAVDVCNRCPLRNTCSEQGYWHQYEDVLGALYICISLPDALDPKFRNFIQELQKRTQLKIDTLLFDDYTLQNILCDVELSIETLYEAMENRKQSDSENMINAASFLKTLMKAVQDLAVSKDVAAFYSEMQTFLRYLNDEEYEDVVDALSKCVFEGEECDPSDLLDHGVKITEIPTTWKKSDSILDRISYFVEDSTAENAPVQATLDGQLHFTHKPRLKGSGIKHLLMMSATTDTDAVKKCFAEEIDVQTFEIKPPTQLAPGNRFFQFGDSLITTQSVFEYSEGQVIELTETAKKDILKICELVQNEKTKTGQKAVLISHKEFTDDTLAHCEVAKRIYEVFDEVTHYHRAYGMNWEDYHIFCCYGLPKSDTTSVLHLANSVNSADTEPIPRGEYAELTEFRRVETNGVRVGRNTFTDERQEQARTQFVDTLWQQGAGRARLFVWENRTLLAHCNVPVDETPHAKIYKRNDLHNVWSFGELSEYVEAREAAEQESEQASEKRKNEKSERHSRDAEIIRLSEGENLTQTEIGARFGITQHRVSQIITNKNCYKLSVTPQLLKGALKKFESTDNFETSESENPTQPSLQQVLPECNMPADECNIDGNVTLKTNVTFESDVTLQSEDITLKNSTDVTLKNKIFGVLQQGTQSAKMVVEACQGFKEYSIRNELSRLVNSGDVVKISRGVYALPSTSPDIVQPAEEEVVEAPQSPYFPFRSDLVDHILSFSYDERFRQVVQLLNDIFEGVFQDDVRKFAAKRLPNLTEEQVSDCIKWFVSTAIFYIRLVKRSLTFEDRARISIARITFFQERFERSVRWYNPDVTRADLEPKPIQIQKQEAAKVLLKSSPR